MRKYYKELAQKVFDLGYHPIPTWPRSKLPFFKKNESWQVEIDQKTVDAWKTNGKAHGGVAITNVVAIDVDVTDRKICNAILPIMKEIFGDKITIRIGKHPKFLVMFHPDSAVSKKIKWVFNDGKKNHAFEILHPGDQYFVAFGVHPDTGEEYKWVKDISPLNIKLDDLPAFDELDLTMFEDAIFDLMKNKFGLHDGSIEKVNKKENKNTSPQNHSDPLIDYKPPGEESPEKVKALLDALPVGYCDDRDEWIRIGSAAHHATGGSDEGFKLFDEWSRKSKKYKGLKDTLARWESFSVDKAGGDCATIGTIVHILQEEGVYDDVKDTISSVVQTEKTESFETRIEKAKSKKTLRKIMSDIQKNTLLDRLTRSDLAAAIRDRVRCKDIKGNWKLSDIAHEITPRKSGVGMEEKPEWLDGYIYITNQDMFGVVRTDLKYKRSAFCGMHNRNLVGRDDLDPKYLNADRYALEAVQIDYTHEGLYFPGKPDRFSFNGNDVYNTYDPASEGERIPMEEWTEQDHQAVKALDRHIRHTFNKPGEADVLLDVMAHIVQNPVERIGWMLILCGCEGDGKTMIGEVLARAVGDKNAGIVNAKDVINNNFTDWVVGHRFKFIEELRATGRNRYEVIDNLKPFVTNKQVSVHPKYMKPYTTPNTASFIATTNHPDAIPYQDDSRRYTVITSRWIKQADIFNQYGADYFDKMFTILERHAPAINEWLATRKISDAFNPHKHPVTPSLLAGIEAEKTDLRRVIDEIIESAVEKNINKNVIVMADLRRRIEHMIEMGQIEMDFPPTFAEIKRAVLKLKYRITCKQHTINGKGVYPYIKGIEENRSNIIDAIENSQYDKDLPF